MFTVIFWGLDKRRVERDNDNSPFYGFLIGKWNLLARVKDRSVSWDKFNQFTFCSSPNRIAPVKVLMAPPDKSDALMSRSSMMIIRESRIIDEDLFAGPRIEEEILSHIDPNKACINERSELFPADPTP